MSSYHRRCRFIYTQPSRPPLDSIRHEIFVTREGETPHESPQNMIKSGSFLNKLGAIENKQQYNSVAVGSCSTSLRPSLVETYKAQFSPCCFPTSASNQQVNRSETVSNSSNMETTRPIYPSAQTAAALSKRPAAEERLKLNWIEVKSKPGIHQRAKENTWEAAATYRLWFCCFKIHDPNWS